MRDLRGKRALVTGAASGIGRAIAVGLAREGVDLCLVDINADGLEATARDISSAGRRVFTCAADLSLPADLSRAAQSGLESLGGLDILVNSAGLTYIGPTEEMLPGQWDSLLAVNLRAPIQLTLALLPSLLANKQAHILNVCSFASLVEHYNETAYTLTKYALLGFSESLRVEYGSRGLGVTALCPGMVRTNLQVMSAPGDSFELPSGAERMLAPPERVAATALDSIQRNRAIVIGAFTPHALWLFKRFFPGIFESVYLKVMDRLESSESEAGSDQTSTSDEP